MPGSEILREKDLVNNPTARVPVCLCLDTSGSMDGDPIRELNKGVKLFYETIRDDEVARYAAEICIVTFGGAPKLIEDFANIDRQPLIPNFDADGLTPMGEAVNMALDCLEKRKNEFKDAGVDYYQPWLVLMTDGAPEGSAPAEIERAINRTITMENDKKLVVFPIGIGDGDYMQTLARFSRKKQPLKLQGLKFKEFFQWLSQSVSKTSQSMPGGTISADLEGLKGWATLE